MTYALPEAVAREEAERLNASPPPRTRYVVDRYPDGQRPRCAWLWGVRREYQYADRPDLGWINGGFIWFPPRS
jgi:hypothetical protein